jgi:hypothetical protein
MVGVLDFSLWDEGASSYIGWTAFFLAQAINFGIKKRVKTKERKNAIIALTDM